MDRIIATFKVLLTGRNIVIGAMIWMTGYGASQILTAISGLAL